MERETLEEAAETFLPRSEVEHDTDFIIGFEQGAKWQQERMYSLEDMEYAFKSSSLTNVLDIYESFEEFIEQFKKK